MIVFSDFLVGGVDLQFITEIYFGYSVSSLEFLLIFCNPLFIFIFLRVVLITLHEFIHEVFFNTESMKYFLFVFPDFHYYIINEIRRYFHLV